MYDWFLILAPVLLLPIVALLRFLGCDVVFGLHYVPPDPDHAGINCGGPEESEEGLTFESDDSPQGTSTDVFQSQGGQPIKLTNSQVTDTQGNPSPVIYGTARKGTNIKYKFVSLEEAGYVLTLKFAEIAGLQNAGERLFDILVNEVPSRSSFDIIAQAGGPLIAFDLDLPIHSPDGKITIEFQGLSGSEALVNAIAAQKRDVLTLDPAELIIFTGATQQFIATANFDPNAQISWTLLHGNPSGQISPAGLYTAPVGITSPAQETVIANAQSGSNPVQTQASISIYLPIDTITKGAWKNKYGTEGYALANTPTDIQLPSYVTQFDVRLTDGTALDVANLGIPANDPRVLVDPNGNPRPALVWDDLNGVHGITISFQFTDNDPHLFGVYCLDNGPDRKQRFTVTQLDSGITETADSAIGTGTYLFWIGKGRIQIDVTKVPGSTGINNVVNAIFFR